MYVHIDNNSFYNNNLFFLENSITDNRRSIACTKCGSFPKYLFNSDTTSVDLKCLKCKQKRTLDMQSIIEFVKPQNFQLDPCTFIKHKEQTNSALYCIKCRKWLCKGCYDVHNQIFYDENHKLTTNGPTVRTCEKHNHLPYKYCCTCCEQSLCKECNDNVCPVTLIKHKLMKKDDNLSQYVLTNGEIEAKLFDKSKLMKDIRFYLTKMK